MGDGPTDGEIARKINASEGESAGLSLRRAESLVRKDGS